MLRMATRYAMRHGMVRLIGGRAVPALLAWDLLMLANRTRQIPVVDRTLRRTLTMARERVRAAASEGTWRRGARGRRSRTDRRS
jgi:hypothetical protein